MLTAGAGATRRHALNCRSPIAWAPQQMVVLPKIRHSGEVFARRGIELVRQI
jgi:hypothetical protein